MLTQSYIGKMDEKMKVSCIEISADDLETIETEALELLEKHQGLMCDSEKGYMEKWIGSKDVPRP